MRTTTASLLLALAADADDESSLPPSVIDRTESPIFTVGLEVALLSPGRAAQDLPGTKRRSVGWPIATLAVPVSDVLNAVAAVECSGEVTESVLTVRLSATRPLLIDQIVAAHQGNVLALEENREVPPALELVVGPAITLVGEDVYIWIVAASGEVATTCLRLTASDSGSDR